MVTHHTTQASAHLRGHRHALSFSSAHASKRGNLPGALSVRAVPSACPSLTSCVAHAFTILRSALHINRRGAFLRPDALAGKQPDSTLSPAPV